MCLLGCDIGSSSIKVSIVDEETGLTIGADFYPKEEAPIKALRPGCFVHLLSGAIAVPFLMVSVRLRI